MTQISDDCFAFGGPLMSVDAALARIAERTPAVTDTATLPLVEAAGHVLARAAVALSASPPQDNAAVDGYALAFADLRPSATTTLKIAGRAAAGQPMAGPLSAGTAARILTGAPMPEGADTVVMQEDVTLEGDTVAVPAGLKAGANRRRLGEDVAEGATLLEPGRRVGPAELALAAAGGLDRLEVHRRPRVTVFSTGDEIVPPGARRRTGAVYDANQPMLLALLGRLGLEAAAGGIVPDNRAVLTERLDAAAQTSDLVLTSGGASTGDEDHVRAAVETLGAVHLWRLAVKPGRPLAFGHIRGRAFVALPGNPVAVLACFLMFVRPLLDRLEGAQPLPLRRWPVSAGFTAKSKPDRREWLRGSLKVGPDGDLVAERYPRQGSGIIHSLTESDGLIEILEDVTAVAPGDRLGFISFREALS